MRKANVCLWRDLSVSDLERLEHVRSSGDLRRVLSDWLNVGSDLCDLRSSALLDLYYHALRFCWDSGFSREQTSCVLSMVRETHAACVGSPLGNVSECQRHLQELLLRHAVHRPPFSIAVFSPQQLRHISHYILETYFRHFKLYKYVFTPQVHLDLAVTYDGISESEDTRTSEGGANLWRRRLKLMISRAQMAAHMDRGDTEQRMRQDMDPEDSAEGECVCQSSSAP